MIFILLKNNLLNIELSELEKKIIYKSLIISLDNMNVIFKLPFYAFLGIYIFFSFILFFIPKKYIFKIFYCLPLFNSALKLLRSYVLLIKYEL